jgi:hypothetical protein
MNRKQFLETVGKAGACACMCAAAGGMSAALAAEDPAKKPGTQPGAAPEVIPETKPGDKTIARGAKRMEFADGWVKRFFESVDQTLDVPTRRRLMEANGKACYDAYAGPPHAKPGPDAVEKFTAWVRDKGRDHDYHMDGTAICFEYLGSAETGKASPENLCLCPMVEVQAAGKISPTYCHCSVGYVREMHERLLGRTVNVELEDSVLRGGSRCRFRMTVA